eukprot:gene8016-9417_t
MNTRKIIAILLLVALSIFAITSHVNAADSKLGKQPSQTPLDSDIPLQQQPQQLCKGLNCFSQKIGITQILVAVTLVLASIAAHQQYILNQKKGSLPGPAFVPPFIGMLFQLILTPFSFYERQEKYGDISWTSILNKFVLFVTDAETTRQVFKEENAKLYLSLTARKILTDKAIPFIEGPAHRQLRNHLLPLFTIRALSSYLPIQESIISEHINRWLTTNDGHINARAVCRDLNMAISTGVFVGPNTPVPMREEIAKLFFVMNDGFLTFPIDLPGTPLRKAILARVRLVELFSQIIESSRARMSAGETPESVIDLWVEYFLTCNEEERNQLSNDTLIFTLLSFMFASQDALSSSLVWVVALLTKHKDVLARVRTEQYNLRPNGGPLDLETMRKALYTRQVVNEILRFRPPAVMVPHETIADIVIGSENLVVPKGTMIMPSIWSAHFAKGGFQDPHLFDPDRFGSERKEEISCAKNYLVFGAGPHYCIGRELAKNQIEIFLTTMAMNVDWERVPTPGGDEIIFGPTIFPKDGCNAILKPRVYSAA